MMSAISGAAAVMGAALLALNGCGRDAAGAAAADQVVYVVSPHGAPIRREFTAGFAQWHLEHYGTPARVEWPDRGGTESVKRYIAAQYARSNSCGYDVMFGGGSGTFDDLHNLGYLQKANLPPSVLTAIPRTIQGVSIRSPDDAWIGATMSYFGIVVNVNRQAELGLPLPVTWKDIAAPDWFSDLAVADPSKSGSVRTCYEFLLQQYGWDAGWPVLVKIFANAEAVRDSGSAPADEVGTANAVAGIVIDFFGSIQIARQGSGIVAFVVPKGGSSLDPDPIAELRGAPHKALADHFLEYVLSPAGQKLWVYKVGTPGGPLYQPLSRKSILENVYTDHPDYLSSPENPFKGPQPLQVNRALQAARGRFLGDLMRATLIDNHALLAEAREAVKKKGDPPELLAKFDQLPMVEVGGKLVPMTGAMTNDIAKRYHTNEQTQVAMQATWRDAFAAELRGIIAAAQ